ncbi:MAG: hypothetical protein ACRDK2_07000, partial [Solirubrobacteraceae bacterium]
MAHTLTVTPPGSEPGKRAPTAHQRPDPWIVALAVSVPLALCYLILAPPSGDLAAATYRSQLFSHSGFLIWDGGWYGGHYLPGYSLLAPALGALLSNRLLLALSTV